MSTTLETDPLEEEKPIDENAHAGFGRWVEAAVAVSLRSNWLVYVLAVVVSLLIGALLIIISGASVTEAYSAMFRGAIYDYTAEAWQAKLAPLTKSVYNAVPLIIAGLGLSLGFRAGLFNIGGQGQIICGAIMAAYLGFASPWEVSGFAHVLLCLLGGAAAGALYGWIPGILKAKTGANEVIVTIMLNSVALLLLNHLLSLSLFQEEGSSNPRSPNIAESAELPSLLPSPFRLNAGLIIAILVALFVWWYLERSTWGFELRAVGANPNAARVAGMSIARVTALTMALSGAFCGLAGGVQVTGTLYYLDNGVAGNMGFDAITVALLGRNKPVGTFFAGLLFGAFSAGGRIMDTQADVPIDMTLILEAVIVLLIAAPPFLRWLFHLPNDGKMTIREYLTLQSEKAAANEEVAA
ncbi:MULTISPECIES: ABC transporter permease [unclassified Actinobaculum]|uniref:ABC transporter permease n=1 Tax=unclassified Actinobaculum TaxID=2609299 RepID=UPI001F0CAE49|nr:MULTISPECIES: ABC transporter permease [unclassified Actinobaculum]